MKTAMSLSKDTENHDTFYDFNKERFILWIIGGFTTVRPNSGYFVLYVVGTACLVGLYLYGLVAGCYTVIFVAKDKSMMVQSGYVVGLMCVSIGLRACRIFTRGSLKHTTKLLRNGIFVYNEEFQDEYKEIKIKRIKDLKFLVSFISNGLFFCAFNLGVVIPLMGVFLGSGTQEDNGLNPYLPLQIYVPFSTTGPIGYSAAYAANALTMVTMYASFVCHEELYMCTTLQLTTELEVLSCSLRNIRERALLRFGNAATIAGSTAEALYHHQGYQDCLYLCLRENIRHHHAILRFRDAMRPYAEAANTLCILLISILISAAMVIMLQTSRPQIPSITDIFGFLPMCWVGQLLVNESSRTKDALFDTPWPFCHEKFKVLLKVLMTNTQKPLVVKAKIVNMIIYLETFAEMASLGYRFLSVLR